VVRGPAFIAVRLYHSRTTTRYGRTAQGQLTAQIRRSMGLPPDSIHALIYKAGGIKPVARALAATTVVGGA
jgi:hypothetical protein